VKNPQQTRDVTICRACGFVAIDELTADLYRGKTSIDEIPGAVVRAGTMERRGREFHMARLALRILGRPSSDVLVYGAGRSLDNHHIAKLPKVGHVAIGDIMNARDDMEFHDTNLPATRSFDIVIASEVIEHFRDPATDFPQLLQFVAGDGILICGTSLRGKGALSSQRYIFFADHTALYSPESLIRIAEANGMLIDFRSPKGVGPRKRYVILTKSPAVMRRVTSYFGYETLAPGENRRTPRGDLAD